MKKLLLMTFAVIGIIFTLLITGMITLAVWQRDKTENTLPEAITLNLRIEDSLYEVAQPASILNPFAQTPMTVQQIVQSIDLAAQDPHVKALTVYLKSGQYGLAQLQEVRDAVTRFRVTGKPTLIFANTLGDGPAMGSYYLASAFEQIWLQPIGELAITGINAEMPFGHELLKKVGVEPQILHRGRYKSYPEMLMRSDMSEDNRAMMTSMLTDIYGQFTKTIAASRHLSEKDLLALIDQAPLSADRALITGLIDSIGYDDEAAVYLEQITQGAEIVALEDYAHHAAAVAPHEKNKPAYIGYVTIDGTLMDVSEDDGMLGSGVASAESAALAIDDAASNEHIRAVVVRVNSPGGSPIAAEIIRRAIVSATEQKPVIISMSDTAASGGYWLSAPATAIVAQPATLTGSIGVFGGKIALNGLWDKLGVNWQEVSFGQQSGIWSVNHPYTDNEQAAIERSLDNIYANFISRVATGRHLTPQAVEEIAQGRVWTGQQAVKIGLVDKLGGLDMALQVARNKAKIKDSQRIALVAFPKEETPVQQLLKFLQHGFGSNSARQASIEALRNIAGLTGINPGDLAAMLAPESLSTYSFVRVY
jgi:protease-4